MLDKLQTMLPGFRVYTVPYEGGVEYHAQLPGNPLYTEQCVGVDADGSLGWSGEQECGDELWVAIHALLERDLPAPTRDV